MKTRYVVLRETETGLEVLNTVAASGAEAAIRQFAEAQGPGTYVATPERSWTQRTVKVEPAVKVSFESAT